MNFRLLAFALLRKVRFLVVALIKHSAAGGVYSNSRKLRESFAALDRIWDTYGYDYQLYTQKRLKTVLRHLYEIYILVKVNAVVYGFEPGRTPEFLVDTLDLIARAEARLTEKLEAGYLADTESDGEVM